MATILLIYVLILFLILLVVSLIQVWLSKRKNRFTGLIIPGFLFIVSIVFCLAGLGVGNSYKITLSNGEVISYKTEEECQAKVAELLDSGEEFNANYPSIITPDYGQIFRTFIIINIYNIILILIYYFNRKIHKKAKKEYQDSIRNL